jgi:hypothetical protein
MRVYVPTTLPGLAAAVTDGGFGPPPMLAFAVTPALREWYVEGDLEELEYAAMVDAARESLRRLDADPDAPPRRVVVALDVADGAVQQLPHVHPGAVHIAEAVPFSKVVSAHVDDPSAAADVRAAAAAVRAADAGDEDAAFTVDGVEDHELQWWATQEIPHLLAF